MMSPVLWGGGTFAGGEASEAESQCMWTTTTADAQLDCCVGRLYLVQLLPADGLKCDVKSNEKLEIIISFGCKKISYFQIFKLFFHMEVYQFKTYPNFSVNGD